MAGKKGCSGGSRKGAGRKPNTVSKGRHTVYCTRNEFLCVKELLKEIRKIDLARKEISKTKGHAELHDKAVRNSIDVQESVRNVTIEQLAQNVDVEF